MSKAVFGSAIFAVSVLVACGGDRSDDRAGQVEEGALSAGCTAVEIAERAERCDEPAPTVSAEGFRDQKLEGDPSHRGRDMFFREGEPQFVLAKFSYGALDDRLKHEDVDVFVLEGCGRTWEKLDRVRTSGSDHTSRTIEGFEDDEGRLIYEIPASKRLPVGRHRVRLVAVGDASATELYIEVLPRGTKLAVIDVDGTLNLGVFSETAYELFDGTSPVREGAPELLRSLAEKGYRPYYLTARADLDIGRTRAFIRAHGLPEGVIHTTHNLVGVFGKPATAFKAEALEHQKSRGLVPAVAFGNQKSDAEAFEHAGIPRDMRFFYQYDDRDFGGRRVDAYRDLIPEISALRSACGR